MFAMLVVSVYLFYGYWRKGLDMERGTSWQGYLYIGVVIAGTTILMARTNYQTYGQHDSGVWDWYFWAVILIFFLSITSLIFLLANLLSWANKYRQKQVEKELVDELE
ncbi:DUF6773 family protein [Streptococcus parasuis]|uniref:DUF6773 family protein n=1 Tax=Streptococcus parasuis TaxID=1501662 RepID=UPI0028A60A42|nr:DUF6773 family protein [Streptococcus parasuis]